MSDAAGELARKRVADGHGPATWRTGRCPHCGLEITLGTFLSPPRYCPRCIGRRRRIAELEWFPVDLADVDASRPSSAEL
jgi:hypothetical protein